MRLFVHRATRVIRLATTDPDILPAQNEDAIEFMGDLDLRHNGHYWKIDAQGQPAVATDQEIDDADVDDARVAVKREKKKKGLEDAVETIVKANPPTMAMIQAYFVAIHKAK